MLRETFGMTSFSNYVHVNANAYRSQKRALDPLGVELQEVNHPVWVLDMELWSPSKAVPALSHLSSPMFWVILRWFHMKLRLAQDVTSSSAVHKQK